MKRPRIYISGRMSGLSETEIISRFRQAELELSVKDCKAICPCDFMDLFVNVGMSYSDILLRDLDILSRCDGIYLLENWKDSKGARAEKAFAEATNKIIMYQQEP